MELRNLSNKMRLIGFSFSPIYLYKTAQGIFKNRKLKKASQKNFEEINFKEILENMKEYVEPGIEEICDWESDAIPLRYIWEGEKTLTPDNIIPKKVTHIYKKITPLDIPIEV